MRQIVSSFERSNTERVVTAARYRMAHHIGLLLSRAVQSVKRMKTLIRLQKIVNCSSV